MEENLTGSTGFDHDNKYDTSEKYFSRPRRSYQYQKTQHQNKNWVRRIIGISIILLGLAILVLDYLNVSQQRIPKIVFSNVSVLQLVQTNLKWIAIFILTLFPYSLSKGSWKINFRPITLVWKTTIAMKVKVPLEMDQDITTFLMNNSNSKWTTFVDTDEQSIILVLTQARRIIPLTPKTVVNKLKSIANSFDLVIEQVDVPKIQRSKFRFVHTEVLFASLPQILHRLGQHKQNTFQVVSTVSFDHFHFDEVREKKLPVFSAELGFSVSDYSSISFVIAALGIKSTLVHPFLHLFKSPVMKIDALKAYNLMRLPNLSATSEEEISKLDAPELKNPNSCSYHFGTLLKYGRGIAPFGIPISDLAQGGIIAGAIGTGKTTLRLHLMKLAVANGVRVIDFDLKGDATNKSSIATHAKVVVPNKNFYLNPFLCPPGFTTKQYSDILVQSFVETLPDPLSPPQLNLLTRAVFKTVDERGNGRQFFKNLLMLGNQEKEFIDNKQDSTAQALMVRFNWMQTTLSEIFWKDGSSLLYTDYAQSSLLFDLSELIYTASNRQIRFLINLIMARIMSTTGHDEQIPQNQIIFVDEAQILMPRVSEGQELTKLEETVATLRYKGISVVAAGISASLMSSILLDVGFVGQFRSESQALVRTLAFSGNESLLPKLPLYTAIIKSNSTGATPAVVKISDFEDEKVEMTDTDSASPHLGEFTIDFDNIWQTRIDAMLMPHQALRGEKLKELMAHARNFVNAQVQDKQLDHNNLGNVLVFAKKQLEHHMQLETAPQICLSYPKQYFLQIMRYCLLSTIVQLRYDPKLNLVEKNLGKIIADLLDQITHLTKELVQPEYIPRFSGLERYIRLISNGETLNQDEERSFFTLTASRMEFLLKEILGIAPSVHATTKQLIDMAVAKNVLEESEIDRLDQFRLHRNSQIHGKMDVVPIQLDKVILAAEVVVKLHRRYIQQINDSEPIFEIYTHSHAKTNKNT